MSDVLFVFATDGAEFHMGIASISAVLKEHAHSTSLCLIHLLHEEETRQRLEEMIQRDQPLLIAVSVMSCHWEAIRPWLDRIRDLTEAPVVVGGWHATLLPEEVLHHPAVDYVCLGEGEFALLELVESLKSGADTSHIANFWCKRNGEIVRNDLRPLSPDLDVFPEADRSLFDSQDLIDRGVSCTLGDWGPPRVAAFAFGRGCYFKCGYCSNDAVRRRYRVSPRAFVRKRSVERALQEIESVVSTYDVCWLEFWDEDFTLNRKWFFEFTEEYPRRFDIPLIVLARPQNVLKDEFKRLREAHCRVVMMGIECGDEEYRRKYMHRYEKNEEIIKAFRIAREHGIATVAFNMAGLPFESAAGIEKTLELNEIIQPDFFYFFTYNPFPGTEFYDLAKENGLLLRGSVWNYCQDGAPGIKGVDPGRFAEFQRRALEMRTRFDALRDKRYPGMFGTEVHGSGINRWLRRIFGRSA